MESDELSVTDAARLLETTPHAVRDLITRGRLPARRFSRLWVLKLADVKAYDDQRKGRARPGPLPKRRKEQP